MQERQKRALRHRLSLVSFKLGTNHTSFTHLPMYPFGTWGRMDLLPLRKTKRSSSLLKNVAKRWQEDWQEKEKKGEYKKSRRERGEGGEKKWWAGRLRFRQRRHIDCRIEDKLFNPLSEGLEQGSEKDREGFLFNFYNAFHIKTHKEEQTA